MFKKKTLLFISLFYALIVSLYGDSDNTNPEYFYDSQKVLFSTAQTCECTQTDQDTQTIKTNSSTISFQKKLPDASKKAKKKKVRYVYITETGSKYHTSTCRYLWNSCYKIKLSKAKKTGYTACSVCNP